MDKWEKLKTELTIITKMLKNEKDPIEHLITYEATLQQMKNIEKEELEQEQQKEQQSEKHNRQQNS